MECLAQDKQIVLAAIGFATLVFEAWLGKTDMVKAGSILELLANAILSLKNKEPKNE